MWSAAQVSNLSQFLNAEDLALASSLARLCHKHLADSEIATVLDVLKARWDDEEQMVSNLLQFPFLIPQDVQLGCLVKALQDAGRPYYLLSAVVGVQRLSLSESERRHLFPYLRKALFSEHGVISANSFIALQPCLTHPEHAHILVDILKMKKSALHDAALSWLVLRVSDVHELRALLSAADVDEEIIARALEKMRAHCDSVTRGETSPISVEVVDYVPNLIDFEMMLDKEDTLSELFDDLDLDKDNKVSAQEVKVFLEDIGNKVSFDELLAEMRAVGVDDAGRIDKDGFIELMFPKFHMQ